MEQQNRQITKRSITQEMNLSSSKKSFHAATLFNSWAAIGTMPLVALIASATWALTVVFVMLAAESTAAHQNYSNVTWLDSVQPIFERRCVGCHKAGGFAPMPLDTYAASRESAPAIKQQVLDGRMPPWPAEKGFGEFSNDRSLTQREIDLIVSWADGGMPEGTALASPIPASAAAREPDLLLQMASDLPIAQYVERRSLHVGADRDQWIAGWEFRPGNARLIQRAAVYVGPDLLGSWVPPEGPEMFPEGTAVRLPADTDVTIEMTYGKVTQPETDRSGIALWLTSKAPTTSIRTRTISCGVTKLDGISTIVAVLPRAVRAGASVEVVSKGRDGEITPLAVVPHFNPMYQPTLRLRDPVTAKRGTVLDVYSPEPNCEAEITYLIRQR
jgi:mono/diheme cytochrome c family protein